MAAILRMWRQARVAPSLLPLDLCSCLTPLGLHSRGIGVGALHVHRGVQRLAWVCLTNDMSRSVGCHHGTTAPHTVSTRGRNHAALVHRLALATKREHEAYLHLPASRQSAAVSAAPKRTAALQVQLCHAQLSGKKRKADDTTKLVGLKGTSGRVVLCKVEAAKLSGMLANWLDTSVSSSWPSGDFTVPFSEEILTLLVSALKAASC